MRQELFRPAGGSGSASCVVGRGAGAGHGPNLQEAATCSPSREGRREVSALRTELPTLHQPTTEETTSTFERCKDSLKN